MQAASTQLLAKMRHVLLAAAALLAVPAASAASAAQYDAVLSFNWTAQAFPDNYPSSGPHWSPPVGVVAAAGSYALFQAGQAATPGLESVAESGSTTAVRAEITAAGDDVAQLVLAPGSLGPSGEYAFRFNATDTHSLLSIVSMVAPSPDWFAGLSVNLYDGAEFAGNQTLDVFMYDAGTDSGATYTAANADTSPKGTVQRIADSPFHGRRVGTLALTRAAASEEEEVQYSAAFRILWTEERFPTAFPAGAHWSPPVGAVHSDAAVPAALNATASAGLKLVAETGGTSTFLGELNAAGDAVRSVIGPGARLGVTGEYAFSFTATQSHDRATVVSMIAPSPDWFGGALATDLYDDASGEWAEDVTAVMYALDAGTDSGATYTAANEATSPPEAVRRITGGPYSFGTTPIGYVRFVRGSGPVPAGPTAGVNVNGGGDDDGDDEDDSGASAASAAALQLALVGVAAAASGAAW